MMNLAMIQQARHGLESCRRLFTRHIYRGRVQRLMKALDLDSHLSRHYYQLISQIDRYLSDTTATKCQVAFDDRTATFYASTPIEHDRFDDGSIDTEGDEATVLRDLFDELRPNDVFYDVGANIGLYSCFVGQESGLVIGFEPHPKSAARLQENLAANKVNGTVHQAALSDTNGNTGFDVRRDTAGGMGVLHETGDLSVSMRTLDHVVSTKELPLPNVVKVDIDGEEVNFLHGAQDVLSSDATRLIYFEVHPANIEKRGQHVEDITDLLSRYGFSSFEEVGRDSEGAYHLKAAKPPN